MRRITALLLLLPAVSQAWPDKETRLSFESGLAVWGPVSVDGGVGVGGQVRVGLGVFRKAWDGSITFRHQILAPEGATKACPTAGFLGGAEFAFHPFPRARLGAGVGLGGYVSHNYDEGCLRSDAGGLGVSVEALLEIELYRPPAGAELFLAARAGWLGVFDGTSSQDLGSFTLGLGWRL
jgi:hypothetical protein